MSKQETFVLSEQNHRLNNDVPPYCYVVKYGIGLDAARAVCERAKHVSCYDCAKGYFDRMVH
jgi:hypothetical protein